MLISSSPKSEELKEELENPYWMIDLYLIDSNRTLASSSTITAPDSIGWQVKLAVYVPQ